MNIYVSIILPVRNEILTIEKTIEGILSQDYPKSRMEILIADGNSDDGTNNIIKEYAKKEPLIKYIFNKNRIVPTSLNLAIKASKGEIIVRMDAHNFYPDNYISTLVRYLTEYDAGNTGCVIKTIPSSDKKVSKAIATGLSSPFGVGNSLFRTGVKKPVYVDTVPFGCFKKEVFKKIGLFDEDLVRNQDDEFNARMIKNGYKILLVPDVEVSYIARDNLKKLSKMLYQYGLFKPLVNIKLGSIPTLRQLIPLFFVLYVVIGGILSVLLSGSMLTLYLAGILFYLFVDIFYSLKHSLDKKDLLLTPFLFVTFPVMHFSHGLGYLRGIWRFCVLRKKRISSVELTR
jgi:glycosyltransferase involved in cell wall biosynthesis